MAQDKRIELQDCDDCPYSIDMDATLNEKCWCMELNREVSSFGIEKDCPMIDGILTYVWPEEK